MSESGVIGRLEKTVLDCPDPRALAAFYAAILGMRMNEDSADWVVIGSEPVRASWRFSAPRTGLRRTGLIRSTPSRRIWTFGSTTSMPPSRRC